MNERPPAITDEDWRAIVALRRAKIGEALRALIDCDFPDDHPFIRHIKTRLHALARIYADEANTPNI